VFALVFLVATTNLGQIQTALKNDATTGSSRTCRVTLVNTRKVDDDGYESRNSHVSVAPLAMMELSYWNWSRVRDRFRVALPLGSRAFKRQHRALSSRAQKLAVTNVVERVRHARRGAVVASESRTRRDGVLRLCDEVEVRRATASRGVSTRTRRARLAHVVRNRLYAHHCVPRTRASSSQRE